MQRFTNLLPLERMHGAWSNGTIVGGAGAFPFDLTVPGGDLPTAGISVVGVLPTHRRRGVLRSLMRAQLDDAHERGEPLAALWASEESIYGRFGYGLASFCGEITLAREYTAFAQPFEPQGTLRLIEPEEAQEAIPPVFERIRPEWPGMFSRNKRLVGEPRNRRSRRTARRRRPEALGCIRTRRVDRGLRRVPAQAGVRSRHDERGAASPRGPGHVTGSAARSLGLPARRRLGRDRQVLSAAARPSTVPAAGDATAHALPDGRRNLGPARRRRRGALGPELFGRRFDRLRRRGRVLPVERGTVETEREAAPSAAKTRPSCRCPCSRSAPRCSAVSRSPRFGARAESSS